MDFDKIIADLIEAGKRNSKNDEAKLTQLKNLCEELLGKKSKCDCGKPDCEDCKLAANEKLHPFLKAKAEIKEGFVDDAGNAVISSTIPATIAVSKLVRVESGVAYPSSAYLSIGDQTKPYTWDFRTKNKKGEIDFKALISATNSFLNGWYPYDGQPLTEDSIADLRAKLATEWQVVLPKFEADLLESMSEVLPVGEELSEGSSEPVESEMTEKILLESKSVDLKKGEAVITIIKEGGGNQKDNHYYPASTLKRDANLFEGAKMYIDHLTPDEEKKLGGLPRSINDWVATIKESWWDETSKEVRGKIKVVKPWFMDFLSEAKDDVGISIRGRGKVSPNKKVNGKNVNLVEALLKPKSVDFVTEAGAGGKVLEILECQIQIQEDEKMFKELTDEQLIAKLKESRPEVYANLQESAAGASQPKLVAIAKTAITASISESIKTSDLPQASKDKLTEELSEAVSVEDFISATDSSAFIGGIVTGAIQKERAYIAKLNESNVITGMGGNTDNTKLTGEQSMSQAFGRKEEKK